jgi:ADP-ribosyl-[dinitrogen reductase] hydrolase
VNQIERFRGCLLGLAVGDAVGTTLEFKPPGSFKPITGMAGGGPFNLKLGEWTDDTSMALCLATSLAENKGFDPKDQMDRYCAGGRIGDVSDPEVLAAAVLHSSGMRNLLYIVNEPG